VDNDETFQIDLQLPNVHPEDVDVDLEGRLLTIHGHGESSEAGYSYSSSFSQSFTLDENVELDKVSASINQGVLTVSAPKDPTFVEKSKLRKIPVRSSIHGDEITLNTESIAIKKPETVESEETDPFRVKETVARAVRQRQETPPEQNLPKEEEGSVKEPGYKMGELRRRR
jgi:HSP20 family protein